MQQINLYSHADAKQEVFLNFLTMLKLNFLFLVFLIFVSVILFFVYYRSEMELAQLKTQKKNLDAGLTQVKQQAPTEKDRLELQAQLQTLEEAQKARVTMLSTLKHLQYEDQVGFYTFLDALSQTKEKGLWLTHFEFTDRGNHILLEGMTTAVGQVPQLIEDLGQHSAFSEKKFEALKISEDEKQHRIHFILESNPS